MQASELQIYKDAIRDGLPRQAVARIQIRVVTGVVGGGSAGLAWDDEAQHLYLLASPEQFDAIDKSPGGLLRLAMTLSEQLGTLVSPAQRTQGATYWAGPIVAYRFALPDAPYRLEGFPKPSRTAPR